jgi:sirohydrochlorin ferrochelatase
MPTAAASGETTPASSGWATERAETARSGFQQAERIFARPHFLRRGLAQDTSADLSPTSEPQWLSQDLNPFAARSHRPWSSCATEAVTG